MILLILLSLVAPAIFSQAMPQPSQERLLNGLKILLWPDKTSEKVSIRIRVHSGSAFDPQGKEGVMQLLADSLFPNQATKDFFKEDLGGSLEIVSNYDMIEISATGKADSFLQMLETLSTAVSNPNLEKEQTVRLRSELLAKVKQREADPAYAADHAAARRLLGTFPYGRPEDGTSSSLPKIDFADLVEAKQRFLTADNATVAIWGNFDRNLALRASRRYFGAWLKADRKIPATFREPDEPEADAATTGTPSGTLRIATRGVARADADFGASMIYAAILETRLRSLAASGTAFVRSDAHTLRGTFLVGMDGGKAEMIHRSAMDSVTEAEFQSARAAFRSLWSKRDIPSFWLDADTYKLANVDAQVKLADAVTLADVNAFAAKLKKQPFVTVMLSVPSK